MENKNRNRIGKTVYSAVTARARFAIRILGLTQQKASRHTVDVHLRVANDLLDQTLLLQVGKSLAGQAAVDLETVNKGSDGNQAVGLDILVELLGGGLVEDDGVLGLVLDYTSC